MAYSYEQERYRKDPTDPISGAGQRGYDMPARENTSFGGLAVAAVLIALFGIVILASAFSGSGNVMSDTDAPVVGDIAPSTSGN